MQVFLGQSFSAAVTRPGQVQSYVYLPSQNVSVPQNLDVKGNFQLEVIGDPLSMEMSVQEALANQLPLQDQVGPQVGASIGGPGSNALPIELVIAKSSTDANPGISVLRAKLQALAWPLVLKEMGSRVSNPKLAQKAMTEAWTLLKAQVDRLLHNLNANPNDLREKSRMIFMMSYLESASKEGLSLSGAIRQADDAFMAHWNASTRTSPAKLNKSLWGITDSPDRVGDTVPERETEDVPDTIGDAPEDDAPVMPVDDVPAVGDVSHGGEMRVSEDADSVDADQIERSRRKIIQLEQERDDLEGELAELEGKLPGLKERAEREDRANREDTPGERPHIVDQEAYDKANDRIQVIKARLAGIGVQINKLQSGGLIIDESERVIAVHDNPKPLPEKGDVSEASQQGPASDHGTALWGAPPEAPGWSGNSWGAPPDELAGWEGLSSPSDRGYRRSSVNKGSDGPPLTPEARQAEIDRLKAERDETQDRLSDLIHELEMPSEPANILDFSVLARLRQDISDTREKIEEIDKKLKELEESQ